METTRNTANPFILMLLALMAVVVAFMMYAVIFQNHAVLQHGTEALAVRQSCSNNVFVVWKEPCGCEHNLTRMPSGKVGDMITKTDGVNKVEISSFIPKDGVLGRIEYWLLGKGAKKCK